MTAASATARTAGHAAPRTSPSTVDRSVLGPMLRWLAFFSFWVWLGFGLMAWGVARSNAATVGVSESVVATTAVIARMFVLAFAVTILARGLVPHVASGRTRRSLITNAAVAVVLTAVVYAALTTVAFQVERPIYIERGWPLTSQTGHVFTSSDQVGLVLAESFGITGALGMAGLAIAAGFRRLGALRGTLALPLTAGPALAATAALELRAGSGIGATLGITGLSAPVTLAVLTVLAALSLLTAYRLVRGAPASSVLAIR